MFTSRALTSTLVVGSVAVASVFAAAPASAATLPDGQQITVIDSNEWQFYEASPADASVTAVGTPTADDPYLQGVDVNDEGHGYAIATDFSEGPVGGWLYTADANTGLLTNGIEITVNFGDVVPSVDECTAIDYTGGVITAACVIYFDGPSVFTTFVGPLDPATGILEPLIELNGSGEGFPQLYLSSIAVHPQTGVLYGFSYEFSDVFALNAWTLSEADGATLVTSIDNEAWGADFDRDGQLWITTYVTIGSGEFPPSYPALATLSLVDGSSAFLEPYTLGGALLESDIDPITVWGVPALAATGVTQSPAVALGAGALLLFGAILAAGTIAVRRRSVES